MAANVETMFSVREEPWHGLGQIVAEAPTSADALQLAGLDWKVELRPIFDSNGKPIEGFQAPTRTSDSSVFGVVSDRYRIVQNVEAFEFTDSLIGTGEVSYETAGSLRGGRQVWLLARMPETNILGDAFVPYMCFTNSHDGKGAVKVCMTNTRVVCQNTLNLALSKAPRIWTTRHTGDIKSKLEEARYTLEMANHYNEELAKTADRLANTKISEEQFNSYLAELFPIDEYDGDRKKANTMEARDAITVCYFAPDLLNFMGTAWGFVNAVADFADHSAPKRITSTYKENNWGRVMGGHPLLDKAMALVG